MVHWKSIVYGLGVFPVVVLIGVLSEEWLILFSGFPSGLIAGYRVGGILSGLLYGFTVGIGVVVLSFGTSYYLVVSSVEGLAPPGIGLTIAAVFLITVLLGIESVIGGVLGGAANRG